MVARRYLLQQMSAIAGTGILLPINTVLQASPISHLMPEESGLHSRTWMAFVANADIWSAQQVPNVLRDLARIARTIASYEPVSVLVAAQDKALARQLLEPDNHAYQIDLIDFVVDDLWLRDTGPIFVKRLSEEEPKLAAVDFNFNGWGGKQRSTLDAQVAGFIAGQSDVPVLHTDLVLEGGCFEVDGAGTAIVTESCVLNDNRNPGWSARDVELELERLLGIKKVIWLKGIAGRDITDGHTDFYARFVRPGEVLVSRDNYRSSYDYAVTRENIAILSAATDAFGNKLKVTVLDAPDVINKAYGVGQFAAGYVGYYVCNGGVITQQFGDIKRDHQAKEIVQKAYPKHTIEQINIDAIASGGGSIHCTTQQQPI